MKKLFGNKSIKAELAIPVGVSISIICLCLTILSVLMSTNALESSLNESLMRITDNASATVTERVNSYYAYLSALAEDDIFHDVIENRSEIIDKMSQVIEDQGYYDLMVSDTAGNAYSPKYDSTVISDRDYYKSAVSGVNYVSDPLFRSGSNDMVIIYSVPIKNGSGVVVGTISAVTDAYELSDMVSDISYLKTGYAFILNKTGDFIAHPTKELVTQLTNEIEQSKTDKTLEQLATLEEKMIKGESGCGDYTYNGVKKYMGYAPIEGTTWSIALAAPDSEVFAQLNTLVFMMIAISAAAIIIGIIIAIMIGENFSKPIKMAINYSETLADGDFSRDVPDEFMNRGDEIGELARSFKTLMDNMNELLQNIKTASEQVAIGAKQISDSSMELSQGATEQASSIEQLTASIEEISSQTKLNADNASNVNKLATSAQQYAVSGNEQMKEMLNAMTDINTSSNNISKIIKVIDDIAFQTNILALNAAVEAARAGQHGKGFAVVAEEVRNLAARSANAAKETTDLIEGSITQVGDGTKIAHETADKLKYIVDEVTKVTELVNGIAIASNEQSAGISQINEGITQVSQVIQENSATSEENASASEELSGQAGILDEQISKFKLKNGSNKYTPVRKAENENTTVKAGAAPKNKNIKISLNDNEFGKY